MRGESPHSGAAPRVTRFRFVDINAVHTYRGNKATLERISRPSRPQSGPYRSSHAVEWPVIHAQMLSDVLFSSHQRPGRPNTLTTHHSRAVRLKCGAPFFTATEAKGSTDPQAAAKEANADEPSLLNRADERASEFSHRTPSPADRLE